ncbi:hypothetical protein SPKIRA_38330 (plasmid) [Sphingomonas paucimobilis]|uniref:hypothetical protein n=1 Tax=Sphingomonas paucimobilis TaxID=13689 RepID=UPI0015DCB441|nr:hypothetical protein [Sphingomonas paucimobilis]BCI73003.1 hypothetical protein SPKIRA_38330 [Sphingomonas paucimobilis]
MPILCAGSRGFPLIRHYQAYFSDAYAELRNTINQIGKGINTTHGGDVPAAFERAVRVAVENREFWGPVRGWSKTYAKRPGFAGGGAAA